MTNAPSISVIIATFTRATLLDECLTHLARQPFVEADELIVVDNGSRDETGAVVERHQASFPVPLRLIYEPRPGKSHALAAALAVARGDVLAFTDDDVNVADGWLDALRSGLADPAVALVGGPVTPRWQDGVPGWIRQAATRRARLGAPLALLDYGPAPSPLGPRTFLGANMAVRREVFTALGGFATHLGKLRGTLLSGEDHELCQRIQQAGYRALYLPDVRVRHWVPAHRARVSYFLRWFYWSGITNAVMDGQAGPAPARAVFGLPFHLIRRGLTGAAAVVGRIATGAPVEALDRAIDVAFVAGYAATRWGVTARGLTAAARSTGGAS
ncbi:MAG: glycosyltransferase family 2 protein [Vicinamibacterales bacterium]